MRSRRADRRFGIPSPELGPAPRPHRSRAGLSIETPAPCLSFSARPCAAIHCAERRRHAGVSRPLAIYLARLGFRVTGEDDAMTEPMRVQLAAAGVDVRAPAALPPDCGLLACSSALRADHPALAAARARGLPVVRRGALLAEVTRSLPYSWRCAAPMAKTTTTAHAGGRLAGRRLSRRPCARRPLR